MTVFEIVMGIILLVMALFLVVAVLMQSGTDKRLSGAIAGGAGHLPRQRKRKQT